MMIAPAPISAPARPTWAALSASSARAKSNSFPTSLASCANASLTRSGIERLFGKLIAVSLIGRIGSVRLRRISRPGRRISRPGAAVWGRAGAGVTAALPRSVGIIRRTLQEPDGAETGEHRQAEEGGRLTPGERLRGADEVA